MTTTTTTKDHTTYDAQGRAHTAPGCGTDAKAGDEAAIEAIERRFSGEPVPSVSANDEFVLRLRRQIEGEAEPTPEPAPLVKLANGNTVTPEQVQSFDLLAFILGGIYGMFGLAVLMWAYHAAKAWLGW
jgi:hypothetical protein